MNEENIYRIALISCSGITCKHYRRLISRYGSAKAVFDLDAISIAETIGSRAQSALKSILNRDTLDTAEEEAIFAEKHNINVLHFDAPDYPQRLNDSGCEDTPPLLFYKGTANLNKKHIVSIVGTRKVSDYGRVEAERIVEHLKEIDDLLIVSGLAYGVDTIAHKSSIEKGIETIGVLGHGLKTIYPPENRLLAKMMCSGHGGLLTEYTSDTGISKNQFPARNRIIAAMSDATIVVEAADRGGALITAGMAKGYHRDVFAVPGRNEDRYSQGCNNLIASGEARMMRTTEDLTDWMGWNKTGSHIASDTDISPSLEGLTHEEVKIVNLLASESTLTMDEIVEKSNSSIPKIATAILSLELKRKIICLAGKKYKNI